MAETNLTGGQRRELTKYRTTFAAALAGLALAGWMIQAAYEQHIEVLRIGQVLEVAEWWRLFGHFRLD